MQHQVSLREINQHLSQYIKELEQGGEIIITKRGQPIAKLSPINPKKRLSPEQQKIWNRLLIHLKKGYHLGGKKFNREEAHER